MLPNRPFSLPYFSFFEAPLSFSLPEIPSGAHRFDVQEHIHRCVSVQQESLRLFLSKYPASMGLSLKRPYFATVHAAATALSVANSISPSRADTTTVCPEDISPRRSFIASGF